MYGLDIPNFDVVDPRALGPQGGTPGSGLYQGLASLQGQGPQPGAPISGSVAGLLGLPTMAGPDGTTHLVQGQGQIAAAPPQPGGALASVIGTSVRSLFDGLLGTSR